MLSSYCFVGRAGLLPATPRPPVVPGWSHNVAAYGSK